MFEFEKATVRPSRLSFFWDFEPIFDTVPEGYPA